MRTHRQIEAALFFVFIIFAFATAFPVISSSAQSNLVIYDDSLKTGWQDWSYGIDQNLSNANPVHSGSSSITVTITNAWGALWLRHADLTNTAYSSISFWANGGPVGGQRLQLYGNLEDTPQSPRAQLNALTANTWMQFNVPLSALDVANTTNFTGFAIQDATGSPQPTFYVDDVLLTSSSSAVHIRVDASHPIRTADARWFGLNTAVWDGALDTQQTLNQLVSIGTRALRFPGGSFSDGYHWAAINQSSSVANFMHVVTNLNGLAMITVNYGTGFTNEAAAWVAYANATTGNTRPLGVDGAGVNWNTAGYWASLRAASPLQNDDGRNFLRISRSSPVDFKYWEIGNEVYGGWETDANSLPHDPYTYALRARDYISLMKAVDSTIKIGVVAIVGEDSYSNNSNHPIVNPRTGQTHYGWTPVLLATLKNLGVQPDFLIYHRYAQDQGNERDDQLLQSSTGWSSDAANLRQQIADYYGPNGTNIELDCTENNSVSSDPGKQTTSLVNGLFMIDSFAQLMQTEFNSLFWWDLHNNRIYTNNNSSSLYGWRQYGDYGLSLGTDTYPTYYAAKLIKTFIQPGDTVLQTTSDSALFSAYGVRRTNGSLAMLAINKDPISTFTGQVAMAGFIPLSKSSVYSYGISQDNAAKTGTGSPDIAVTNITVTGTNLTYSFSPYSATVFLFPPTAPTLRVVSFSRPSKQIVLEIDAQPGVPFRLETSTNLLQWFAVSTNTLGTSKITITNVLDSASSRFWRTVWQQ